jgi:biopolymer transport protein ExbD
MKRLSSIPVETSENVDINLSPLIDMVFLLLIFFMVTAVFVEETGVEVQKPKAISAVQLEKQSILLAVTRDGRVMYGGRSIGLNGVRGLVARLLESQKMPVVIVADEVSRTGIVVQVLDQCKLAGARQVSIAATRKD